MNFFARKINYLQVFAKNQKKHFLLMISISLLGTFTEGLGFAVFIPLIAGIDAGTGISNIASRFFALFGLVPTQQNILASMIVLFSLRGLLKFCDTYMRARLANQFVFDIQRRIIKGLTNLKQDAFQKKNRGEMSTLYTGEIGNARIAFYTFSSQIVELLAASIFALLALALNYQHVLIAITLGSAIFGLQKIFAGRSSLGSRVSSKGLQSINNLLLQALGSFKYLKTTNTFRPLTQHLNSQAAAYRSSANRIGFYQGLGQGIQLPSSILIFVIIILWTSHVQNIQVAQALGSLALIHRMVSAVNACVNHLANFSGARGSVDLLLQDIKNLEKNHDDLNGVIRTPLQTGIKISHLDFSIGEKKIIRNLEMEIAAKSVVGLTGRSGSGKTTLIDLITGVQSPTQGTILIDGTPLSQIDLRAWQSMIGIVSQEIPIFNDTVFNNVSLWGHNLAAGSNGEQDVWDALTLALADDFVRDLPLGLETPIGEKGVALSGGQKQRIAIARELLKKPRVLILDEATSALDTQTERAIHDTLEALKGNVMIIIVAHRLSTLQLCDSLYVLEEGQILEQGSFDELYNNTRSHFRQLWDNQALAPKTPSTRVKAQESDWKLSIEIESGLAPVSLENISESGLAIVSTLALDKISTGSEIRGKLEYRGQSGMITIRLIHRFGGVLGCVFVDMDAPIRHKLGEFIKGRSSLASK